LLALDANFRKSFGDFSNANLRRNPVNLIALLKQTLREIGAVLSRDARDDGALLPSSSFLGLRSAALPATKA
jgi:hypothetical protein